MHKSQQYSKLDGSTILITGGTGSFGNQVVIKLIGDYTSENSIHLDITQTIQHIKSLVEIRAVKT